MDNNNIEPNIIKSMYHLYIARLYNNAVSVFKTIRLHPIKRFCEVQALYHTTMHVFYDPDYRTVLEKIDIESEEFKKETEERQKACKLAFRRYLQEMGLYQSDLEQLNETERDIIMEDFTFFTDPEKCKPNMNYVDKMRKKYNLPKRVISDSWVEV